MRHRRDQSPTVRRAENRARVRLFSDVYCHACAASIDSSIGRRFGARLSVSRAVPVSDVATNTNCCPGYFSGSSIASRPVVVAVLHGLNTIAALTIAVFKATIVVLFFMHVKYSTRLTWVVVIGSIFWLGILLTLTLGDYLTRAWRTYG